jgi:polyisoprenoid-binding protein YceI
MGFLRSILLAPALLATASHDVAAAPVAYILDVERSMVGFEVDFGSDRIKGSIPVSEAQVVIDFDRVANTSVSVTLDTTRAVASFPFATQAMRGPSVLASAEYPTLSFRSRSVRAEGAGARVTGDITIRGQTRPIALDAQIYRQRGQAEGDRSRMSILLRGTVDRSDFGATGWSDMVGNEVALDILVRVSRAP